MRNVILVCSLALLLPALLALVGCETQSADERPVITPSAAVIRKGQSIEFTATSGYQFQWRLKNENWGVLSSRTGDRVVYTSVYQPGSNTTDITQILTATSIIPGSGVVASNLMGEAFITHL